MPIRSQIAKLLDNQNQTEKKMEMCRIQKHHPANPAKNTWNLPGIEKNT